jgi:hypothetical protein
MGIDQFIRTQSASTLLALVTISSLCTAFGAGTHYISVRKETLGLLIIILFTLPLHKLALIIEFLKKFRCSFVVNLGTGTGINIKLNPKIGKRVFDDAVIFVHNILGGTTLLSRLNGDGNTMLIGTAYKESLSAAHSEVPYIYICRNINTCKMTDMNGSVGIR